MGRERGYDSSGRMRQMQRVSMTGVAVPLSVVSFILVIAWLWMSRHLQWDVPELETIAYCVIVVDVFLWIGKATVIEKMGEIETGILSILGITSWDEALDNDIVQNCSREQYADLMKSVEEFRATRTFPIGNPYIARDISFKLIETIKKHDTLIAFMNLAARPFLLKEEYTSYFNYIHKKGLLRKKTSVTFTRILIVNDTVKESAEYTAFVAKQKTLRITVLECPLDKFQTHNFPGDLLIRLRGDSRKDDICLLGDKDPETPLDKYEAKVLCGENQQFDHWLQKAEALIEQIS